MSCISCVSPFSLFLSFHVNIVNRNLPIACAFVHHQGQKKSVEYPTKPEQQKIPSSTDNISQLFRHLARSFSHEASFSIFSLIANSMLSCLSYSFICLCIFSSSKPVGIQFGSSERCLLSRYSQEVESK